MNRTEEDDCQKVPFPGRFSLINRVVPFSRRKRIDDFVTKIYKNKKNHESYLNIHSQPHLKFESLHAALRAVDFEYY